MVKQERVPMKSSPSDNTPVCNHSPTSLLLILLSHKCCASKKIDCLIWLCFCQVCEDSGKMGGLTHDSRILSLVLVLQVPGCPLTTKKHSNRWFDYFRLHVNDCVNDYVTGLASQPRCIPQIKIKLLLMMQNKSTLHITEIFRAKQYNEAIAIYTIINVFKKVLLV